MIELRNGASVATIDAERGGRLASLVVDGRDVIVGPPDEGDRTILWGSFLMAPWCGRVEGGVLEWDGRTHRLPVTDEGNAIHGVLWDQAWTVEAVADDTAVISARLEPGGWPFAGLARQLFELRDGELVTSGEVLADEPMPAALGWHPWFNRTDEDPRLTIHSSHTLETRDLIPTGRRLPVDGTTDLRHGTEIGERLLDHCYTEVRAPALAEWPGFVLEIAFDEPLTSTLVHTRATSFCIEPQSAWPTAIALEAAGVPDTGLAILGAGDRLAASMALRWRTA